MRRLRPDWTGFAEIRDAHPEWKGEEGTMSYVMSESEVGEPALDGDPTTAVPSATS